MTDKRSDVGVGRFVDDSEGGFTLNSLDHNNRSSPRRRWTIRVVVALLAVLLVAVGWWGYHLYLNSQPIPPPFDAMAHADRRHIRGNQRIVVFGPQGGHAQVDPIDQLKVDRQIGNMTRKAGPNDRGYRPQAGFELALATTPDPQGPYHEFGWLTDGTPLCYVSISADTLDGRGKVDQGDIYWAFLVTPDDSPNAYSRWITTAEAQADPAGTSRLLDMVAGQKLSVRQAESLAILACLPGVQPTPAVIEKLNRIVLGQEELYVVLPQPREPNTPSKLPDLHLDQRPSQDPVAGRAMAAAIRAVCQVSDNRQAIQQGIAHARYYQFGENYGDGYYQMPNHEALADVIFGRGGQYIDYAAQFNPLKVTWAIQAQFDLKDPQLDRAALDTRLSTIGMPTPLVFLYGYESSDVATANRELIAEHLARCLTELQPVENSLRELTRAIDIVIEHGHREAAVEALTRLWSLPDNGDTSTWSRLVEKLELRDPARIDRIIDSFPEAWWNNDRADTAAQSIPSIEPRWFERVVARATAEGDQETIDALVKKLDRSDKVDLYRALRAHGHETHPRAYSPLHHATQNHQHQLMQHLLDEGADPNEGRLVSTQEPRPIRESSQTQVRLTPLAIALRGYSSSSEPDRYRPTIELLVAGGADPALARDAAIFLISGRPRNPVSQELTRLGVPLDAQLPNGETLLTRALLPYLPYEKRSELPHAALDLLRGGADPDVPRRDGKTPRQLIEAHPNPKLLKHFEQTLEDIANGKL